MSLRYLNGRSWAEVTRDERYFCQHLFGLLRNGGAAQFLAHIDEAVGRRLPLDAAWEPAFEVCFYRDLWHLTGRSGELFSPKRTFDLALFSDDCIVIIEAKAQQTFDAEQLTTFSADRGKVRELTGVRSVFVVGLASSACQATPLVLEVFDGPLLTWRSVAGLFGDDPVLLRADAVYESERAGAWGRNNGGGYMTGEALRAAFLRGERFCVGRGGGLNGPRFAADLRSGDWRLQRYETSPVTTPPNPNWFTLEAFARAVSTPLDALAP